MVASSIGTSGGSPLEDSSAASSIMGQDFLMQQVGCLAHLRQSHKAQLRRLQTTCLHLGETRQTQIMVRLSLNGLAGVSRGVKVPFQDL